MGQGVFSAKCSDGNSEVAIFLARFAVSGFFVYKMDICVSFLICFLNMGRPYDVNKDDT